MAFIDGYVRGKPARIADNLIRLFPGVYSAEPPEAPAAEAPEPEIIPTVDAPDEGASTKPAAHGRKSRKDA